MTNKDFEAKIKALGLNKKEFAKISCAAYQTVTNWRQIQSIPFWVEPFLSYYEQARELESLLNTLEKCKKDKNDAN
ncbi:hypothetical protein [Helicobacter sp. 11S02629-2]|uniref:hypothetical protein n=1 Tax=Helicobacter sp. 11S02629-2 TaxID=1476195 RepID=UPI000BA776F7|nr:hypothetical protein [Helicobacter sp. 11S02629-2]PAF41035.1 hypothetical protein BKH40_08590 [Helicobacter sp. 11S02629-2]PAF41056.1 hypothetical protein BKH40_08530 [Helicobacter sp. 11S02629-2]